MFFSINQWHCRPLSCHEFVKHGVEEFVYQFDFSFKGCCFFVYSSENVGDGALFRKWR